MGKGKMATQVAHAAVDVYKKAKARYPDIVRDWESEGEKKVVLKADSLERLMEIKQIADKEGIPNVIIHDAGRTQLEPGTATCLGLGPWDENELDKITGGFKLL